MVDLPEGKKCSNVSFRGFLVGVSSLEEVENSRLVEVPMVSTSEGVLWIT
jgi:hypothetical protein